MVGSSAPIPVRVFIRDDINVVGEDTVESMEKCLVVRSDEEVGDLGHAEW